MASPGHNHDVLIDFDEIFRLGPKSYNEQVFRKEDHHLDPHYSDAIMSTTAFKSPTSWLFAQPSVQAQMKETSKFHSCNVINIFESIVNSFTDTVLSILKPQV